jgi:hypothetical protein
MRSLVPMSRTGHSRDRAKGGTPWWQRKKRQRGVFNACCDVEIDDLNTVWLLKWVMTYSQWEERCSGDVRYSVGVTHQRHTTLHYTILHYTVLLRTFNVDE